MHSPPHTYTLPLTPTPSPSHTLSLTHSSPHTYTLPLIYTFLLHIHLPPSHTPSPLTHKHILSDVVRLERPDLEKQRNELIVNINKAKNELKVGK